MKPDHILTLPAQPVPYAVLGSPINHSLSPVMQQAAFDHAGLEARYYRIEVDDEGLEKAVDRMRQVPFGGWNCTIPNKVRMYELCDRRAESAEQFRAVNTVVNEDGELVGHNTDGVGWSRALREAFGRGPDELRILLLGAGGAGRAIATQAILEKCPGADRGQSRSRPRAGTCSPSERAVLHGPARPHAAESPRHPLGRNRNSKPRCAKSISSSTPPRRGSIPRRRPMLPARLIARESAGLRHGLRRRLREIPRRKSKRPAPSGATAWACSCTRARRPFRLWTGRDAPLEIMRAGAAKAHFPLRAL